MAGIRVEQAALRLVAPPALRGQAAQLRQRAESRFVPALLHGLAARLRRRYGDDAVLRLPSLRLRLRMPPSALEAEAWIEQICDDLAEQVQQAFDRAQPGAMLHGDRTAAQRFHDPAHERALRLLSAARRERGPRGERERFERLWAELRAAPARDRAAVLMRCAELPDPGPLLARWSVAGMQQVLDDLPAHAPAAWRDRLEQAARARASTAAGRRPAPAADSAAAAGPAAVVPGATPARGAEAAGAEGTPGDGPAAVPRTATASAGPAAVRLAAPGQAPSAAAARTHEPAVPITPESATRPHAPLPTGTRSAAVAAEPPALPSAAEPAVGAAPGLLNSRWCGLPALLNLSLRLELPERLWQIGVDEGDALAAMLARLSGDDAATLDQPAVRLVARAFPGRPAAVVAPPAWARDELDAGIEQALARWPVWLERQGALRERVTELQAWHGRSAGFDLAAWGAAWHQALAEALLDERLTPAALQQRLGGAGQVLCDDTTLRVVQPLSAIDIGLRRAGLDADPGWLPWLDKRLVFVFEGPEPAELPEP